MILSATPAWAAVESVGQTKDLTGITNNPYFADKFIQTNKPSKLSKEGWNGSTEYSNGDQKFKNDNGQYRYSFACPEVTKSITDCDVIFEFYGKYLVNMVKNGYANDTYSPENGVNSKVIYYLIVELAIPSGTGAPVANQNSAPTTTFKVPIIYTKDSPYITTRIPWASMSFSSPWLATNGLVKSGSNSQGTSAAPMVSPESCMDGNRSQQIIGDKQDNLVPSDNGGFDRNYNAGHYSVTSDWVAASSDRETPYRKANGKLKSLAEIGKKHPIGAMNIYMAGYAYQSIKFTGLTSHLDFWGAFIKNPFGGIQDMFDPVQENNTCQIFVTGKKNPNAGDDHKFYMNVKKNYCFEFDGQPVMNTGGENPLTNKRCKVSDGQDYNLMRFGPNSDFYFPPAIKDAFEPKKSFEEYASEPGHSFASPGFNCGVVDGVETGKQCDYVPVNNVNIANNYGSRDPLANPSDRKSLAQCFSGNLITFDFEINWDCIHEALFIASKETQRKSDNAVADLQNRVPFNYIRVLEDAQNNILGSTGQCREITVPILGQNMTVFPCMPAVRNQVRPWTTAAIGLFIAATAGSWAMRKFLPSFDGGKD